MFCYIMCLCNSNVGTKSGSEDSSFNNLLLCALFICGDSMDNEFLTECVDLAIMASKLDEVPVGAIIVKNGKIVGKGYNRKESSGLCTRHAEIAAIEEANKTFGSWRLDDCVLYVTLEPCLMCCGAILESRIKKVIYLSKRTNVLYNSSDYINSILFDKNVVLKEKYLNILSDFFKKKR